MATNNIIINQDTISEEQENGLRLQLLREKIEKVLRDEFHNHFAVKPHELYQQFETHRNKLEAMKKKGKLSKDQFQLLLPTNGVESFSNKFDTSLLLILLSEFCGLQSFKAGWKPEPSDRSKEANIYRFRMGRNKIQHMGISVTKKEFNEIFVSLKQPLLDFGCSSNEVDALKSCGTDRAAGERIKKLEQSYHSFNYNFNMPIQNFIGRDSEIDAIHNELVTINNDFINNGIKKYGVVVSGMTGVGKTETVKKYWEKNHKTYYENSIIWINAQTKDSIENSFLEIGTRAGLTIKNPDGTYKPVNEIIYNIYRHFSTRTEPDTERKVLFVFDNVKNYAQIEEPYLPSNFNFSPFIIVTSQSKDWDSKFKVINLDVFELDLAYKFLRQNVAEKLRKDEAANNQLLVLLERHPLAMQQAISYVNINQITIQHYVELFTTKCTKVFFSSPPEDNIRTKPAFKAFLMSLESIKSIENCAPTVELLNLMAHLDGKHIEKGLLVKFFNDEDTDLNVSLRLLYNYSLINISPYDETHTKDEQIVTMHSLIQMTIRFLQENNDTTDTTLDKIFDTFFEDFSENTLICNLGKNWFNQYLHLFNQNYSNEKTVKKSCDKQYYFLKMFEAKGRLLTLLDIFKSISALLLETDHQERINLQEHIIATQHNIAIATCHLKTGMYKEAFDEFYEVEKKQTVALGSNHPSLLTTQHNIAQCLLETGMYKEALDQFYQVEKKKIIALGSNHPSLLPTKNNIALCLMYTGMYEEALDQLYEVEKKKTIALRSNHPSLLTTQHCIAFCLMETGMYKEALDQFYQVEKKETIALGLNHPSLLSTQSNIALCLMYTGMYKDAFDGFYEVEKKRTIALGLNHPDLLITQHNIALCLMETGMYKDALDGFYEVEKKRTIALGSNHPDLLLTQHNIAFCLMKTGMYKEALDGFYEVEKKQTIALVSNHPHLLCTQKNIAFCRGKVESTRNIVN